MRPLPRPWRPLFAGGYYPLPVYCIQGGYCIGKVALTAGNNIPYTSDTPFRGPLAAAAPHYLKVVHVSEIFSITVPIFFLIGVGFMSVRLNVFGKPEIRTLGSFVLTFALPALVIRSFSQRSFAEVFNLNYVLAYALGSLAVFFIGLGLARKVLRAPLQAGAIAALGMTASNSGFIGYPLAAVVIGPSAVAALSMSMLVENILVIPLAVALAESGTATGGVRSILSGTMKRLIRTPMIIAILIGTLLSLLEWKLPAPLLRSIDMLAMASGAVALFAVGGMLHGLRLGGMVGNLSLIVVGKLVLHPLAIILALLAFPIGNHELTVAAILLAASPMLSIYPILGQRFGQEKLCAAALLCATVMSFFTLSLLIWMLRQNILVLG
jgi:malonate transporter